LCAERSNLIEKIPIDLEACARLTNALHRYVNSDIPALEQFCRRRAHRLLDSFISIGHTTTHIKTARIHAARLPGPREEIILPGRAGKTGHALEGHGAEKALLRQFNAARRSAAIMLCLIAWRRITNNPVRNRGKSCVLIR
jgi:hypothetical protein